MKMKLRLKKKVNLLMDQFPLQYMEKIGYTVKTLTERMKNYLLEVSFNLINLNELVPQDLILLASSAKV